MSGGGESPIQIYEDLCQKFREMDEISHRQFLRGNRTPRDIMIEHFSNVRALIDDALDRFKAGEE